MIDRAIRKLYRLFNNGQLPKFRLPFFDRFVEWIIKHHAPDVVIVHEPEFLLYVTSLKEKYGFRLAFNAHEYYPLQFEHKSVWMRTYGLMYADIYRKYLDKVDLMINVCESIAKRCKSEFEKDSIVIPNAAFYRPDIQPRKVGEFPIRLIHHGAAIRSRSLETMINAVAKLGDSYQLDLMLVENEKGYYDELNDLVSKTTNVKMIAPVDFDNIVPFINKYDIGLYSLKPSSYNQEVALPNKLFEYIQARLCLVVSPSVEMSNIVVSNDLGIVSRDYDEGSIAAAIGSLTIERVNHCKEKANIAARKLSAEQYEGLFLNSINSI
ncbi:Glycosyltransferase involved in cell wall bisynthesis [Parapedobacter indicus]|uniref:Glycosyltransferase involved in cell wall bisynthesis n=1 Tax=Parapedobacter indicus TaxID=1477437 RepID=A0A1I3TGB4_9SPHI|nr:glycosyltransferase involved in cell wall biosynthesis [Parapedobacter indicus]SFJ68686.1 Glycosyltransferase involved in cell wall bisynthesis [Parapedobacter indicus]